MTLFVPAPRWQFTARRAFAILMAAWMSVGAAQIAHGAGVCNSPYDSASNSAPAEIVEIHGLFEEVWPPDQWMFYADRCRTQMIWYIQCSTETCRTTHQGFTMTLTAAGRARLSREVPSGARLSYFLDGLIADIPMIFSSPVDTLLESYLGEGGKLMIETPDERVEVLPLWGFADVLELMRKAAGRPLTEDHPTIMSRYESLHDPLGDDPYVFLPATKPQIQFAIRAQGGTPFLDDPTASDPSDPSDR